MKQWFVGLTKDQQELKAATALREQGYMVYLPKIYLRHQNGRKVEAQARLRFTGYIFIAAHENEMGPISNTRGMDGSDRSALICSGSGEYRKALPVPAGIIETLRAIEDDELARALERKKPKPRTDLTAGDEVMIAGDRNNPAFGRKGHYLGTENFEARVLEGWAIWLVAEIDLKKIEQKDAVAA